MAKESEKILDDVLKIYEELYEYKDILSCKKLFKYDVEKVVNALEQFKEDNKIIPRKTSTRAKKEKFALPEFNSMNDVRKFYYENLIYDRADKKEEKKIVDNYSKEQYVAIYMAIYNQKPTSKVTKKELLEKIQNIFDSEDRSMKI